MQNTLLAIAIALIAAIGAALIGPVFVDWNAHRPRIEAEASRLFGTPVKIGGDLSIRLLPTIRVDARDVSVGAAPAGARIGRLQGELRVAPLLRGEVSLTSLHVRDADIVLTAGSMPSAAIPVEQIAVENARLSVAEAEGPPVLLAERMMLSGESRGTRGPVRLEGSAIAGEAVLPVHAALSISDAGALLLRLRIAERAGGMGLGGMGFEAEGTVGTGGRPRFDGEVVLTGRAGRLPWRIAGPAAITPQALVIQRAEAQAGTADRIARATGSLRYQFGGQGGLQAVVNARQIDLDRLTEGASRTPRQVVLDLLDEAPGLAAAAFPVSVGLDVAGLTLGGAPVADLRGDLQFAGGGWQVERLSARLPGDAAVEADGRVRLADAAGFSGRLSLKAARPAALMSWLDGQPTPPGTLDDPIEVSTSVTADAGRLLLDGLEARTAAGRASGRLVLDTPALGRHALEAELTAEALDLDLLARIARGTGARLDPATDARVRLRAGEARLAGFLAKGVELSFATDGRTFDADRIAVADFAGLGFELAGRLDGLGGPLVGRLSGRMRAGTVDGLVALLSRDERGLALASWLRDRAAALAGADLAVTFAASGRSALGLRVEGRLGEAALQLDAAGAGDPLHPLGLTGRVNATVEAPRPDPIFALLAGRAPPAPAPALPSRLALEVERPAPGSLRLAGSAAIGPSRLTFDGAHAETGTRRLAARLSSADASALLPFLGIPAELAGALPAEFDIALAATGAAWRTERAEGRIGGTPVGAALTGTGLAVRGRLVLGAVPAEAVLALLSGPTWLLETGAGEFSTAAFGPTVFDRFDADIAVTAERIGLGASPPLDAVTARLSRSGRSTALRDLSARIAGARLKGEARLDRSPLRALLSGRVALEEVPAALAWPGAEGTLGFEAEIAGDGATPAALVSSLNGTGRLTWNAPRVGGVDPSSLARVTRQAELAQDLGRSMTDAAFADALARALERAVPLPPASSPLTWTGLVLRAAPTAFAVPGGRIAWSGSADLREGRMSAIARIAPVPIPEAETMPVIAVRYAGPFGAPVREVDADDVSGWLGLRLVDRAAERIRMAESDRLERARQRAFTRFTMTPPPQVEVPLPPMPPPPTPDMFLTPPAGGAAPPAAETAPVPPQRPAEAPPPRAGGAPPGDFPAVVRRALEGTRPPAEPQVGAPLSILPPLPPPVEAGPAPGLRR